MVKSIVKILALTAIIVSCAKDSTSVSKRGQSSHPKDAIVENPPISTSIQREWHLLDLVRDQVPGISLNKSFEEFNLSQSQEVVVAVIDSGVDISHERLRENIWVNLNEIPDNGIDDDENGYVDDINGWNFLGNSSGENIDQENLEETRIYRRLLSKLQEGIVLDQQEEELFNQVKEFVESGLSENRSLLRQARLDARALTSFMREVNHRTGLIDFKTREDIESLETLDSSLESIQEALLEIWDRYWLGFSGIKRTIENSQYHLRYGLNLDFDPRKTILNDDTSDFSNFLYGNNNVIGPDSEHGTHVAGTVLGVAAKAKIMVLRAVPNGDERDKDIAASVKYAVDNGAKIINLSFGKNFSPHKDKLDEVFNYAAEAGVLIIHAAGNNSQNIDGGKVNYPNSYQSTSIVKNTFDTHWMEISASTKNLDLNFAASFSNYGKEAVNLFAPGEKIYSTVPDNKYSAFSGTSMAAPIVSGVAAILMSEFPTIKAEEVRDILIETVEKPRGLEVRIPFKRTRLPNFQLPTPFENLSSAGGYLSAFKALELSLRLAGQK